jgi:hypothetical protein
VPPTECEHGVFDVVEPTRSSSESDEERPAPLFPRGGHNYYGRDMEKFTRRMEWVSKMMAGDEEWTEKYKLKVAKHEHKLSIKKEEQDKSFLNL